MEVIFLVGLASVQEKVASVNLGCGAVAGWFEGVGVGARYQINRGMSMRWRGWFKGIEDGRIAELRGAGFAVFYKISLGLEKRLWWLTSVEVGIVAWY